MVGREAYYNARLGNSNALYMCGFAPCSGWHVRLVQSLVVQFEQCAQSRGGTSPLRALRCAQLFIAVRAANLLTYKNCLNGWGQGGIAGAMPLHSGTASIAICLTVHFFRLCSRKNARPVLWPRRGTAPRMRGSAFQRLRPHTCRRRPCCHAWRCARLPPRRPRSSARRKRLGERAARAAGAVHRAERRRRILHVYLHEIREVQRQRLGRDAGV